LLLSARAGEESAVEGLEAGADDYLVKPFSRRELLARVAAKLELGRSRKESTRRQIQLYADVVRNTQVGIVVWQLEDSNDPGSFRLLIANPAASEITGVDFEPLIGTTMAESFSMLLQTPLVQQYVTVVQTGQSLDLGEVSYRDDGVTAGIYSLKAFALSNQCLGLAFENITARKQVEAQLQKSLHYNQQIIEAIPGIVFVYDLVEQQAVYNSPQITDLLGYTSEQVQAMGSNVFARIIYADDIPHLFAYMEAFRAAPDGTVHGLEYRVHHANGECRWLYSQSVVFNRTAQGVPRQILGVSIDVTDRKQAELVLVEQKRLLELTASGYSLDECLSSLCASVSKLNPGVRACILLTDAQRLTFKSSITPEFPPSFGLGLKDAAINELAIGTCGTTVYCGQSVACADIANDDRWSKEWRNLCISHGVLACYSAPILDVDALPLGSLMLCFDEARMPTAWEYRLAEFGTHIASIVFERDRSNLAVRESEEKYRTLTELSMQHVWMLDAAGELVFMNQNFLDFFGKTLDDLKRENWAKNTHHPDDHERVVQTIAHAMATGTNIRSEHRIRRHDNQFRWFLHEATPLRDASGSITHWLGASVDIDDIKQAQEALRESQELKQRILESSQDCIKVLTLDGRLLYMNEGGTRLFEVDDPSSLLNATWVSFWQGEDQEKARAAIAAASSGNVGQFQGYCPTAKGKPKWWDVIVTPIRDASGQVVQLVTISRDITKQKQAEAEREQLLTRAQAAREQAETANRIKDEFLAVLSHELRSPLNPILGWTSLLRNGRLDAAKTAYAVETIDRNARLQVQLIEDLLDVSRILSGKLSLNIVPVDLGIVIRAALENVRVAAVAKSLQIQTTISPTVRRIKGDAGRLQQVLWNLLANAVKFTPEGGQITVALTQVGTHAQIQVTDTGKGINPEFLPYVFEHFRQEDGATTRKFGGLGLGLAIVRHLVELHGGTVQVESLGVGQGATFTVKLPLLKNENPRMRDEPILAPVTSPTLPLSNVQVLVVDDEVDTRELIVFVLEQAGTSVTAVSSAFAALEVLAQFKPDVLVSDIGMPEMDGYMLMQHIQALSQGKQVPAVAVTAYAGESDRQQALAAGFQRHISKPIEPEMLVQTIVSLIAKGGIAEEAESE
jgi:PAS domain S-box-containing protein